jgi:5-methylcytosine-specific restriction endonuclease McrA
MLVAHLEKMRFGRTDRPRPAGPSDPVSRHVPAHVRRAVGERDGYRCTFVGREGRCTETAGLEFHHAIPFADGGLTTVDNLQLRCRAHNAYEADRWAGTLFVRERGGEWLPRRSASRETGATSGGIVWP